MSVQLIVALLIAIPVVAPAQKREIVELQRDVADLRDQVRTLQSTVDQRFSALTVLVQQTQDSANKAAASLATVESAIRERLKEQANSVSQSVVPLGTKVDQMSNDFAEVREAIKDLTSRMERLQQQITDLGNAVRTIQSPPQPAPGGPTPSGGPSTSGLGSATAPMPAAQLYESARRDMLGGRSDLALEEFAQYLKYYGNTDLGPNAQYYVGEIHASQGNLEAAIRDFDMVLEKYPENAKTPDALYMKGQSLVRLHRATEGAKEFQELIRRFPRHELAAKAREQLRVLGMSAGAPRPAARRKR